MAGADIKAMVAALEDGDRDAVVEMQQMRVLWERIAALDKPTVAAIGGIAAGGGLELALACDLRIAGASARLGLPEIRLGLIPGAGGTQRLTRLVGPGRALDLILDGRLIDAETAAALGIVTRAIPDDRVDAEALEAAARLAAASPVAVRLIKRAVRAAAEGEAAEGRRIEADGILEAIWTDEALAGLRGFLDARSGKA
jgi:enoyl-CoA hydratase/carnithine racemase